MTDQLVVDEGLVRGWMTSLRGERNGLLPGNLVDRWQSQLLVAVREATAPDSSLITGRFAVLDSYLTGVAAGIAAGLGTSPASDGGDSDPIILAAGLLAGSAAVQARPEVDRYEAIAAGSAAAAVVDAAADGASLATVVRAAGRAAAQVRLRTLVGLALGALSHSIDPDPQPLVDGHAYEVALLLEPSADEESTTIALDRVIDGLCLRRSWIPVDAGFRLLALTRQPGPFIETVWAFGRVRDLSITCAPDALPAD